MSKLPNYTKSILLLVILTMSVCMIACGSEEIATPADKTESAGEENAESSINIVEKTDVQEEPDLNIEIVKGNSETDTNATIEGNALQTGDEADSNDGNQVIDKSGEEAGADSETAVAAEGDESDAEFSNDEEIEYEIAEEDRPIAVMADADVNASKNHDIIVWLGDSLTQGSLGHDNDNLSNAPYVKLANMSGLKVEGFGYYGYNAHDIAWCYKDESQANQTVDPQKVYVFWMGANDWAHDGVISTDVNNVIAEIDSLIAKGLNDYIVLGTIARKELRADVGGVPAYELINIQLRNHYGNHYMDVIDIITENGYGPDDVHLKQESYDRVAAAVYKKLQALGYIAQ